VAAQAPAAFDHLCSDCASHFSEVNALLDKMKINYTVDKNLVRGLDYYVGVTFEMVSDRLGGQDSVAGGGRYDGLIEAIGGPNLPATGFAIGMERLLLLSDIEIELPRPQIYLAALGDRPRQFAFELSQVLRMADKTGPAVQVQFDLNPRSLKAQMRQANKVKALLTLIIGDRELDSGQAILKNMATGDQVSVPISSVRSSVTALTDIIKKTLNNEIINKKDKVEK
jgi:histidyl-tRNA synthetase